MSNKEMLESNVVVEAQKYLATNSVMLKNCMDQKFNGTYCANNSTVAYQLDGVMYVAPCTQKLMREIDNLKLKKEYFYVPCSNQEDFPEQNQKLLWKFLVDTAIYRRKTEFIQECERFSTKHNILEIGQKWLERCLTIPETGIPVKRKSYRFTIFPEVNQVYLDCTVIQKLGKFNYNNGFVMFVYLDGKTYLTKGYKIIEELQKAGFQRADFNVPLSNNEIILDNFINNDFLRILTKSQTNCF